MILNRPLSKNNGFLYMDESEDGCCAIGSDKKPSETEEPSTQLSMCAWDGSSVNVIGYMVRFQGKNSSSKMYDDFNKFLTALANAEEAEAFWESDKTDVNLVFGADYSEDGYTYLDIYISNVK